MTSTPKPGAVVFAKGVQRVAKFYEELLSLSVTLIERDHVVLESASLQLVIHAIPSPIASSIVVTEPPAVRDRTAVKLFFPVASLAEARARGAALGGQVSPSEREWEGGGFRACDGYDPEGNVFQLREAVVEGSGARPLYHGTKAELKPGDLIGPGYSSNYGERKKARFVYLSETLNAATWGAELAAGEGRGRIYRVESTGPIEDDPNLTDKKYPGNPTKSYRSRDPLRVLDEVTGWDGHSPEELEAMRGHLERLRELGVEAIED